MGMRPAERFLPRLLAAALGGSSPGRAAPAAVPTAPNASILTAWVLGCWAADASALGMAPGQTLYAWVLRVLGAEDVSDRVNFARAYVGWIEAIGARPPGGELP